MCKGGPIVDTAPIGPEAPISQSRAFWSGRVAVHGMPRSKTERPRGRHGVRVARRDPGAADFAASQRKSEIDAKCAHISCRLYDCLRLTAVWCYAASVTKRERIG
jgi:hypothetical protein